MLMAPHREERYIAIKALKGYLTDLIRKGIMWELETLERITSVPPPSGIKPTHCPQLLANFIHPRKNQDGDHLCFITDVMGRDIKALQVKVAGQNTLPLPLAKCILLHTLHGLVHMHHCGIVHTDLKHDNIMFDTGLLMRDDIATFIKTNPTWCHPAEESWQCVVQAAVSQPLPLPLLSEAMTHNYMVSDFGSGEPIAWFPNLWGQHWCLLPSHSSSTCRLTHNWWDHCSPPSCPRNHSSEPMG